MYLKNIKVKGFRNINNANLSFNKNVNVIVGENAQGKTNLLESIFLLSGSRSFRGSKEKEMIKETENSFYIEGNFEEPEKQVKYASLLENGKLIKKVIKNDKAYKSSRTLVGHFPMTAFSPDDLLLIKGSPSLRRDFLDSILCSLFPSYLSNINHYEKLVMHKNKLLKEEADEKIVEVYSMQMAKYGTSITLSRLELIEKIKPYIKKFFNEMANGRDSIDIFYECSSFDIKEVGIKSTNELCEDYLNKMLENKDKENFSKQCLYGPHRDELKIFINGKEAKSFASQGQIRSAVISLILAKTELIKNILNKAPIVILDDVMSELDSTRQKFILDKIKDFQVFISCCQKDIFENRKNKSVFEVKNGEILKIEE